MSKKKVNEAGDKGEDRERGGWPMWVERSEEILEGIRAHVLYYPDAIGIVALGQAALQKGDARRIAFYDLVRIADLFVSQLIEWGFSKEEGELHEWAGSALANIIWRLQKRDTELGAANLFYMKESAKIRKEKPVALYPKSKISRIVRRELGAALEMRKRLVIIRAIRRDVEKRGWESKELLVAIDEEKARLVPREYFPFEKLPPFSVKFEQKWWDFLWPFLQKKINVSKLPPLAQRDLDTLGTKPRKRYHSTMQTHCRDHLKLLARLHDEGIGS
jgi:hypothetical protein